MLYFRDIYIKFNMTNLEIKKELLKLEKINDARLFMMSALKDAITIFSKNYSNYDETEFTDTVKFYKNGTEYIVTKTLYNGLTIEKLDIILTKKEPKSPHPIFPILCTIKGDRFAYEN